jgi:hypothetical protein
MNATLPPVDAWREMFAGGKITVRIAVEARVKLS